MNAKLQEKQVSALGQVMVAISSLGPDPGRLLRKTARLAAQLNAQWYAVYVRTPKESAIRIDAAAQRRVHQAGFQQAAGRHGRAVADAPRRGLRRHAARDLQSGSWDGMGNRPHNSA